MAGALRPVHYRVLVAPLSGMDSPFFGNTVII